MRILSLVLIASLILPPLAEAKLATSSIIQSAPITKPLSRRKKDKETAITQINKDTFLYKDPILGMSLVYPKERFPDVVKKTSVTISVAFGDLVISARKAVRGKNYTAAVLDKRFDSIYTLDGQMSEESFISDLDNLERADITIGGQLGRQYSFTGKKGNVAYNGIVYLVAANGIIYDMQFSAAPEVFAKEQKQVSSLIGSIKFFPSRLTE